MKNTSEEVKRYCAIALYRDNGAVRAIGIETPEEMVEAYCSRRVKIGSRLETVISVYTFDDIPHANLPNMTERVLEKFATEGPSCKERDYTLAN